MAKATLLDVHIRKDLSELISGSEILAAVELNANHVLVSDVSTKGLPGYFTGDRKAKTVMVMLNPGGDAEEADRNYRCQICKACIDDMHGLKPFISTYLESQSGYGWRDRHRYDAFDLKQALFLCDWTDCGVTFPKGFPNDKTTYLKAKENVLMQKLQLELVPYCSSTFAVKNIDQLLPYVETLFDEIFSYERKYVIFCSNVFESLFKHYKKWGKGAFSISMKGKEGVPKTSTPIGYCTKVSIIRNEDDKEVPAIIAHTFAKRNLARDAKHMRVYGKACYNILFPPQSTTIIQSVQH